MRKKVDYETPEIEITKFDIETNVLNEWTTDKNGNIIEIPYVSETESFIPDEDL